MNDPYFEMLIHEYNEYMDLLTEIQPLLLKDDMAVYSWGQYSRAFALDLVANVDPGKMEHRAYVNNITIVGMAEMTANEYRDFFESKSESEIDAGLYADFYITKYLVDYDLKHKTKFFRSFISHYCTIAEIFSDQSAAFRNRVDAFIQDYKESGQHYWDSKGVTWGIHGKGAKPNTEAKLLEALSNQNESSEMSAVAVKKMPEEAKPAPTPQKIAPVKRLPKQDNQFRIRVLLPIVIGIGLLVIGIIAKSILPFLLAIPAFIMMIIGLKANKRRCPQCRAWDSIVTVKSERTGERKVKVRRNLNSTYFRTSGNTTFGSRQVFVNADEITFNETYRCTNCGYETKGTKRVIDDGIR